MIDWTAFITVAVVSLVAASLIVTLYALGVRLFTASSGRMLRARRVLGIVCFVLCAGLVLFGIYLIVPALHGG